MITHVAGGLAPSSVEGATDWSFRGGELQTTILPQMYICKDGNEMWRPNCATGKILLPAYPIIMELIPCLTMQKVYSLPQRLAVVITKKEILFFMPLSNHFSPTYWIYRCRFIDGKKGTSREGAWSHLCVNKVYIQVVYIAMLATYFLTVISLFLDHPWNHEMWSYIAGGLKTN